jgi:D-alanyl-D-alanine carboxypeptidase
MADTGENLQKAIIQQWNIPDSTGALPHQLLEALAKRVSGLIDTDINRLMTAMYTLDIDETRFAEAMGLPDKDMAARAVAELILEREIQKMETRRQYDAERKKSIED